MLSATIIISRVAPISVFAAEEDEYVSEYDNEKVACEDTLDEIDKKDVIEESNEIDVVEDTEAVDENITNSAVYDKLNAEDIDYTANDKDDIFEEDEDVIEADIIVEDNIVEITEEEDDDELLVGSTEDSFEYSGMCGENVSWSFDPDTGVLTISGTGKMYDYGYDRSEPDKLSPFVSDDSIQKVIFEEGITYIGENTFNMNDNLTEVIIPGTVKKIGSAAFGYCGFDEINIPEGVESLDSESFFCCKRIGIPKSVTYIGYCTNLKEIYYEGTIEEFYKVTCGDNGISFYFNTGEVLPSTKGMVGYRRHYSGVDKQDYVGISEDGILYLHGLNTLSGTYISKYDHIKEIKIDGYKSIDMYLSAPFSDAQDLEKITISNTVINLGKNNLFTGCEHLKEVILPENLESINDKTFGDCKELTEITVTAKIIGNSAFSGLSNLKKVTFTENVESIGNNAFSGCIGLDEIVFPRNVTEIGKEAFLNCSSLTNITIPENVTAVGSGAFLGCSGLKYNVPISVDTKSF